MQRTPEASHSGPTEIHSPEKKRGKPAVAATSVPSTRRAKRAARAQHASNSRRARPDFGGPRARAGRAAAGLGNNAKSAATAGQDHREKREASRTTKLEARRRLAEVTSLPRVSKCGRVSMGDDGEVALRYGPAAGDEGYGCAGFGGLVTCGSVWACPVCSAKIATKRAAELDKLIRWNVDRGGSVGLLTLTMRHHKGQRLRELRRGLTGAWRHITESRGWKQAKTDLGLDGYVRAIECTHSVDNGWHLHIHVLLIFDGPLSQEMAELLALEVWERWAAGLARQGLTALQEHAVDVRIGDHALERLGKYINKLAFEAVGGRWKKGRKGGRTPFEILGDALATGLADEIELWWEWEQASKGMQQLVWSGKGETYLKKRAGIDHLTDEQVAEETERGQTIAILPARTWKRVYPVAEDLLNITERGGPEAAYRWLDTRGLPFEAREPDPDRPPAQRPEWITRDRSGT